MERVKMSKVEVSHGNTAKKKGFKTIFAPIN